MKNKKLIFVSVLLLVLGICGNIIHSSDNQKDRAKKKFNDLEKHFFKLQNLKPPYDLSNVPIDKYNIKDIKVGKTNVICMHSGKNIWIKDVDNYEIFFNKVTRILIVKKNTRGITIIYKSFGRQKSESIKFESIKDISKIDSSKSVQLFELMELNDPYLIQLLVIKKEQSVVIFPFARILFAGETIGYVRLEKYIELDFCNSHYENIYTKFRELIDKGWNLIETIVK